MLFIVKVNIKSLIYLCNILAKKATKFIEQRA